MVWYANAGTVGVQDCTILTYISNTGFRKDFECLVEILQKTLRDKERSAILEALESLLKSKTLDSLSIESSLKGTFNGDKKEDDIRQDLVNIIYDVDAVRTTISGFTNNPVCRKQLI
jgi:mRNA-degrading endonuclease YafQ of YafQ-DinJ toxin-antitoxin module